MSEYKVIEQKVTRNFSLWYRVNESNNTLGKWNDAYLNIVEHNTQNGDVSWWVDVIEESGKTFLVYEVNLPESVCSAARKVLNSHGYKWNRVVNCNGISDWIIKAENLLAQIETKKSSGKSYHMDVASAKSQFDTITNSIEYKLFKNHLDHDQLHTNQYENYFHHIIGKEV